MDEDQPVIDDLLAKAECLKEQGSLSEAMQLFQCALKLRDDPIVLTRIGSLAIDLKRWDEAEDALLSAIRLGSDEAYPYLGIVYRAQGRLQDALECLKKATRDEASEVTFTLLGVIQAELDLTNEARESFRRAISLNSGHEEAYYNLAVSLRNDQKEGAIALLQKAIDINSTHALAHRELGWLFRRTNQFPEAEYHLRRAIELDSSDGWSYVYLANLMWESKDFTSAEVAFTKAIDVWPDRSLPYWRLAHFRECQGRHQEAEQLYKKALDIDPGDAQANWRFGNYLKAIGEYERARHYLHSALELDPNDERPRAVLAELEAANHIES